MPVIRRKTAAKPTAPRRPVRDDVTDRQAKEDAKYEPQEPRYNRSPSAPRQAQEEKSGFVNLTKLYETKKNPDNLVGTCRNNAERGTTHLDDLAALIAEAQEKELGITFFAFLAGQWGPSLAATLARPEEDRGSFNDGPRQGGSRNYSRNSYGRR